MSSGYDGSQAGFGGTQFEGGGGFFPDDGKNFGTQNNFDHTQSSPQSSQGGGASARKRDEQSLTPLSIKQLKTADKSRDAKIRIDTKDVAQVTLIGNIVSLEVQPTNISVLLDDGTGQINVRNYVDQEEQQTQRKWQVGDYVRVIGNLRVINSDLSVVGFQLLPITDFNELTFHLLEVIHTHLRNTKGPRTLVKPEGGTPMGTQMGGIASPPPARYSGFGSSNSSSSSSSSSSSGSFQGNFGSPCGPSQASFMSQSGPSYSHGGAAQHQSHAQFQPHAQNQGSAQQLNAQPVQAAPGPRGQNRPLDKNSVNEAVMMIFTADNLESGTHVDQVIKRLPNIPATDVRKAIEYLTDEGHLYSTIDEFHFKSTTS